MLTILISFTWTVAARKKIGCRAGSMWNLTACMPHSSDWMCGALKLISWGCHAGRTGIVERLQQCVSAMMSHWRILQALQSIPAVEVDCGSGPAWMRVCCPAWCRWPIAGVLCGCYCGSWQCEGRVGTVPTSTAAIASPDMGFST